MKPLTLGELIAALADVPKADELLIHAPMRLTPTCLVSYRGYYEDLAIGYTSDYQARAVTVESFLGLLGGALAETFTGYKGGNYTMHDGSAVWVSEPDRASGARVVGVESDDDGNTWILTLPRRWSR